MRTITEYRESVASAVTSRGGRVVDAAGNNVLAEFASVVDAREPGGDRRRRAHGDRHAAGHRRLGGLALAGDAGVRRPSAARQAVGGRPAVREPRPRPRAGVLQRRGDGGPDQRAVEGLGTVRHRPELGLHLQGPGRHRPRRGSSPRRALRAGRQRAALGQSRAHHGPARGRGDGLPPLGRAARPRGGRHVRPPGRGHPADRRRAPDEAHRGREGAARADPDARDGGLRPRAARHRAAPAHDPRGERPADLERFLAAAGRAGMQ